ncbi:hypothetical protein VIGAN_10216700, partial [Vigna angularis var. angularis]
IQIREFFIFRAKHILFLSSRVRFLTSIPPSFTNISPAFHQQRPSPSASVTVSHRIGDWLCRNRVSVIGCVAIAIGVRPS